MTWLDDLQRRLAVAGARSLGQGVAGQVGRTLRGDRNDVWETATTEPPDAVGNAPECEWCPVCRAIRMAREARPDVAARIGDTAGALMSVAQEVAQEAVAAIDAAISRASAPPPHRPAPKTQPGGEPHDHPDGPAPLANGDQG